MSGRRGKNAKAALTLAGLVKTRKDAAGLFGQAWRIFETLLPDIDKAGWPGARTRLVPRIAPLLFRLALVRRFLFRAVSQIGVNYRNSPLSMGAAGAVRGGDRLPWVETEPGKDNFAPLASLTWQVHVYGEPRRGVAEVCVDLQLPLHLFTWQPAMQRAGLRRAAFYLVRPDGYVALAEPHADPERLREYFRVRGMAGRFAVSGERLAEKGSSNKAQQTGPA